jgi:hypothetical protein
MRTYPLAPVEHASLNGAALPGPARAGRAVPYATVRAALHVLGGPAAVLVAAADRHHPAPADLDDWSGSFDIHLGVYASD